VLWSRGPTLDAEHLSLMTPLPPAETGERPESAPASPEPAPAAPAPTTGESTTLAPPGMDLERWERAMIEQALRDSDGNQTRAAQRLGISRDTLRYRLKKYGIQ
jgi:DNA-binding NtrC family response regulator